MKNAFRNVLIFTLVLPALTACSMFSPVANQNSSNYLINLTPTQVPHKRSQHLNILVAKPEARDIYNTVEMAYSTHPYEVDYFSINRWAETPPQMLQPLIIQTLRRTHYFHRVDSSTTFGQYDLMLVTHLIELLQDYSTQPATVHLKLRAELIDIRANRQIAAKDFSITEPIGQNTPYGDVVASNKATAKLLQQLARFCLRTP